LSSGSVRALPDIQAQTGSLGISHREIIEAVLRSAAPEPGLSWLDIGCGTGELLRSVRDRYQPVSLTGVDLIDRLAADLVGDVAMRVGPAETSLVGEGVFDRVTLVETIEHLDAPWSVLELAITVVAPGGLIVVSTPNITTLRHRTELALRGTLTSFRPDNEPHQTPALPHVIERYMRRFGMITSRSYAGRDQVPTLSMPLPRWFVRRWPELSNISVICVGAR
jgi:ubiquinone/menaquinone biosynthesis C-methylase UbiE